MAKRAAQKTAKATSQDQQEEIALTPAQTKALKLADKSAKFRTALEQAVAGAAAKAVRKVLKDQAIVVTAAEADTLTAIWFGE